MHSQNINWKEKTILVAEDDIVSYKQVQQLLTHTNARVIWAETGDEAVFFAKHKELCIDAVLMNIQIPELDGFATTKQLKADHPNLPVIMLYAQANNPQSSGIVNIFDGQVAKPIQNMELIKALQFCFEQAVA